MSERFNIPIPDNMDEQVVEGVLEEFEGEFESDLELSETRALEEQDFFFFNQSSTEVRARIQYVKPLGEINVQFNRKMSFPDDFVDILNYWILPKEIRDALSGFSEMDADRRLEEEEED